MARDAGGSTTGRALGLGLMGVGALLLLAVPVYLLALAFGGNTGAQLAGTWLILTVVAGMTLVALGATLRD